MLKAGFKALPTTCLVFVAYRRSDASFNKKMIREDIVGFEARILVEVHTELKEKRNARTFTFREIPMIGISQNVNGPVRILFLSRTKTFWPSFSFYSTVLRI
jgi:hypothetical protein